MWLRLGIRLGLKESGRKESGFYDFVAVPASGCDHSAELPPGQDS